MLELVTDLESTDLTKIDLVASAQQILFSRAMPRRPARPARSAP
jgi:hypothetical protein